MPEAKAALTFTLVRLLPPVLFLMNSVMVSALPQTFKLSPVPLTTVTSVKWTFVLVLCDCTAKVLIVNKNVKNP